jgi:hypothetical protein
MFSSAPQNLYEAIEHLSDSLHKKLARFQLLWFQVSQLASDDQVRLNLHQRASGN